MKVSELIKELKKHPKDTVVVWQDHDEQLGEFNGICNFVDFLDCDSLDEVDNPFEETGTRVVLHT